MKSLKNYIIGSLICLLIFFVGGFFVGYSNGFVLAEEEGEGTVETTSLEGKGTEEEPYLIKTAENFEYVSKNIASGNYASANYILTASIEIDLSKPIVAGEEVEYCKPIGTEEAPFRGVFDGNGKTITVKINGEAKTEKIGVFGFTNGAEIKNLAVEADFVLKDAGEENKKIVVGGIVGNAVSTIIKESYCEFKFKTTSNEVLQQAEVENFYEKQTATIEIVENKFTIGEIEYAIVVGKAVVFGEGQKAEIIDNKFTLGEGEGAVEYIIDLENSKVLCGEGQEAPIDGNKFTIGETKYEIVEERKLKFTEGGEEKTKELKENKFEIDEIEYVIKENKVEYPIFETFKFGGELVVGGIVGEGSSVSIKNSYSIPNVKLYQTSNSQTFVGGIVGAINNGEIKNVYVAPTTQLASAIASKNGVLAAVEAKDCQIYVNSTGSEIVVGGIAGNATGGNLVLSNTFFGGMVASNKGTVVAGGIVGKIPTNKTFWPKQIEYGKYVGLSNPSGNVVETLNAIGNKQQVVEFSVPTSVSPISVLPTLVEFKAWNWNIFDSWDFENIWKEISVVTQTQGFFPLLQRFSTFKIQVATNKVVSFDKNGNYLSGYLTFKINSEEEGVSTAEVSANSEVKITATFYSEEENELRNFKNYFLFTNWLFNEVDVKGNAYAVVLNENGTATITFKATSKTEGIYDIGVKGRPVQVNVSLKNTDSLGKTENIGKISKVGTEFESVENFSFEVGEYLNGEVFSLKATGTESGEFIFDRWQDLANEFQTSKSETVFELNNEKISSSSRVYPVVKFEDGKLVANIDAYFSNNTSKIKFEIVGNGKIVFNETEFNNGDSNSFVNQKQVQLTASPNEENEFVGWFVGDEMVSKDLTYAFSVSEDLELTAKFKEVEKKQGLALPIWAIVVIAVVPIVLGGIIALIVVKVKKNKKGGYKKHYRY